MPVLLPIRETRMRKDARRILSLIVTIPFVLGGAALFAGKAAFSPAQKSRWVVWSKKPAPKWDEAYPVGNGRLGAMVYGRTENELIQFNEESLWSGKVRDTTNPDALKYLPEVRRLLFNGQAVQAQKLAEDHLMGNPKSIRPYQSFGNLRLTFPGHDKATNYLMELDLDQAVVTVRYQVDGVTFTREIFSSHPDQVIVIRVRSSQSGRLEFLASLDREQEAAMGAPDPDSVALHGVLDGGSGLRFQAQLKVTHSGGHVAMGPKGIQVSGAQEAVLVLAANTSFRQRDPGADSAAQADKGAGMSFDRLLEHHLADYQPLFRRVDLDLGITPNSLLPTDERLQRIKQGEPDPELAALYFQFGRYLLLSSSRPGDLPANLQGIWAEGMKPPWSSDYHLNINLQMNYWPAEAANLAECALPLFDFLETLREPGRRTARSHYGARGFVAHHLTDLWGFTTPADAAHYGLWPMGAAWLCQHLWEHYAFSGDLEFLSKRAYPTMREAAEFFLDYLVESPQGWLVTGPSMSPENSYRLANGQTAVTCMGPTMDTEIVTDLFNHCIQASELLGRDLEFRTQLQRTLKRLPPLRIGKDGRLLEWLEEYVEPEPGHRHMSHLFALHPGNQITLRGTPDLAKAARAVLDARLAHGGGHTGWSRAWIINFFARLEDGEECSEHLQALFQKSTNPNLFDMHPPFQIDGNFGAAAGIAEMLLQSHAGEISLLPALPKAWPRGYVKGLRARGGLTVDIKWNERRVTEALVHASRSGRCRLRAPGVAAVTMNGRPVKSIRNADGTLEFDTVAGGSYSLMRNGVQCRNSNCPAKASHHARIFEMP